MAAAASAGSDSAGAKRSTATKIYLERKYNRMQEMQARRGQRLISQTLNFVYSYKP